MIFALFLELHLGVSTCFSGDLYARRNVWDSIVLMYGNDTLYYTLVSTLLFYYELDDCTTTNIVRALA